jgi:hypothetical protein
MGGGPTGPSASTGAVTTATTTIPMNGGGNPPSIFDGDHSRAQEFMGEFKQYWMLNPKHPNLSVPAQRVIMCLTFMRGPKVVGWVDQKTEDLQRELVGGADPDNQKHWDKFVQSFKVAFEDTRCSQTAFNQLMELTMKGSDLDGYITHFETL